MAITKPGTRSWPNLIAQWRLSRLAEGEFVAFRFVPLIRSAPSLFFRLGSGDHNDFPLNVCESQRVAPGWSQTDSRVSGPLM